MTAYDVIEPALAMGNTVVLKPAEQTPLTALRLAELVREAGVPEGVFTVVTGPGSGVGTAIVRHPLVCKVAFTGSTEVGKEVMRLAADDIKRVSLELGGKSADVIFDDCDFDRAVASAASSALGNAGQDCCARSRILVHAPIYDRFVRALTEAFENIRIGDPLDESTEMGPLVTAEHPSGSWATSRAASPTGPRSSPAARLPATARSRTAVTSRRRSSPASSAECGSCAKRSSARS